MQWCTRHWKEFKGHSKTDTRNSKTKPQESMPFNISEGNLSRYGESLFIHFLKLKKWLWWKTWYSSLHITFKYTLEVSSTPYQAYFLVLGIFRVSKSTEPWMYLKDNQPTDIAVSTHCCIGIGYYLENSGTSANLQQWTQTKQRLPPIFKRLFINVRLCISRSISQCP